MKLKYYLRGVGIGIIFATLVMTVSSFVHKNNLTDEYIIKEARKLGMIMKEEDNGLNDLFGNNDTQSTEEVQVTEETQDEESEAQPSESESESQTPVVPETPVEPEPPVESEKPVEPEPPVESEEPVESESDTTEYVTVVVAKGDYARQVAEKVKAAGLIEDAEDFRKYMGKHGYAQKLHAGSYKIPVGADYAEICKILTTR